MKVLEILNEANSLDDIFKFFGLFVVGLQPKRIDAKGYLITKQGIFWCYRDNKYVFFLDRDKIHDLVYMLRSYNLKTVTLGSDEDPTTDEVRKLIDVFIDRNYKALNPSEYEVMTGRTVAPPSK